MMLENETGNVTMLVPPQSAWSKLRAKTALIVSTTNRFRRSYTDHSGWHNGAIDNWRSNCEIQTAISTGNPAKLQKALQMRCDTLKKLELSLRLSKFNEWKAKCIKREIETLFKALSKIPETKLNCEVQTIISSGDPAKLQDALDKRGDALKKLKLSPQKEKSKFHEWQVKRMKLEIKTLIKALSRMPEATVGYGIDMSGCEIKTAISSGDPTKLQEALDKRCDALKKNELSPLKIMSKFNEWKVKRITREIEILLIAMLKTEYGRALTPEPPTAGTSHRAIVKSPQVGRYRLET